MADATGTGLRTYVTVAVISSLLTAAVVVGAGLLLGIGVVGVSASGEPETAALAAYDTDTGTLRPLAGAEAELGSSEMLVALNQPGPAGPQGPKGDTGAQGEPGAAGPQGTRGDTGPKGAAGTAGASGATGVTGAVGPQGVQGDIGATGAQGVQGDIGASGPVGPTGPQGVPGPIGVAGPTGPKGDTGDTGPQGAPGTPGAIGPRGSMGPPGPEGPEADLTRAYREIEILSARVDSLERDGTPAITELYGAVSALEDLVWDLQRQDYEHDREQDMRLDLLERDVGQLMM